MNMWIYTPQLTFYTYSPGSKLVIADILVNLTYQRVGEYSQIETEDLKEKEIIYYHVQKLMLLKY